MRDNGVWVEALKRPNVELVTDPIEEINASGVKTSGGKQYDADVLIYGTGFHASNFLRTFKVYGREGTELHDRWNGDARAYLGMTVPGFPNFFIIYGPEHQHRRQWQHHLLQRMLRALHHREPENCWPKAATPRWR